MFKIKQKKESHVPKEKNARDISSRLSEWNDKLFLSAENGEKMPVCLWVNIGLESCKG